MQYIEVKETIYTDPNVSSSRDGKHWHPATPERLSPNLKEWFIHSIMRKHFTFGQPYCVVCGREQLTNNK